MSFQNRKVSAVIASGGQGVRMNAKLPKQFLPLAGKPILAHTLAVFYECGWVDDIIIVTPASWIDYTREIILKPFGYDKNIRLTAGGGTRGQSVYQGVLAADADLLLIHDGVRPFITEGDLQAVLETALGCGACSLGVPVKETIKVCDGQGFVLHTPPRETLWQIQTPQGFQYPLIRRAHDRAAEEGFEATDDAALAEWMGCPVRVIQGRYANVKITTEEDRLWCEYMLAQRRYP